MFIALVTFIITVLLALGFYYFNFYRPKRNIENLAQQFTQNNWSVYVERFAPMSTAIFDNLQESFQKHKDSMYAQKFEMSKYDVYIGNIDNRTFVQFHSPQIIQEFFHYDNDQYLIKEDYFIRYQKNMSGDGITFVEGEQWKGKRKTISKFLSFDYLKDLGESVYTISDKKFNSFFEKNIKPEKQNGEQVSEFYLQNVVELIPATVLVEVFFGGTSTSGSLQIEGKTLPEYKRILLSELRTNSMDSLVKILGFKFTKLGLRQSDRRVNNMLRKWKTFIRNFIVGRFQQIRQQKMKSVQMPDKQHKPKDLTEAFFQDFESKGVKDKQILIQSLMSDFSDLLVAAVQATSVTILMAVYFVHKHKNIKQTLLKELSTIKNEDLKDVNSLKKLKYLECIIWETTRRHQIANGIIPREVVQDFKIGGVTIKKGSIATVSTCAVHYQNKLYEDAESFKPERWIQQNGEIRSFDSNQYLSFGAGIRGCVGKALALIQTKVALAYFMKNFEAQFSTLDLQLNMRGVAGYEPQPIKMKLKRKKQPQF